MEFKDIVTSRRSVRKFSPRPVEREVIQQILDAAIAAPSSRNSHSTSFHVVTSPEQLERLSQMRDYGAGFVKGATAAIVVVGDSSKTDLYEVNSAICATTLQLAITDLGLASCWVHIAGRPQLQSEPEGAQADEVVRSLISISEEQSPLCLIAFGYSEFEPAPLPEFDRAALVTFVE